MNDFDLIYYQSLLLGLKYSELSWEMAKPSDEGNADCLPCLFLQFSVRENGTRVHKILQVFSKQVYNFLKYILKAI